MKKLNEIWVPRSKAERWISIIVVWGITTIIFEVTNESEMVAVIGGIFSIAFTVYAITQGTDELKETDKINKEKREVESEQALQDFQEYRESREIKKNETKLQKKGIDAETGELICPKCGSSDLSANRKGYTWFLGSIRAKKVYVTCLRCGKQWRAGKYGR